MPTIPSFPRSIVLVLRGTETTMVSEQAQRRKLRIVRRVTCAALLCVAVQSLFLSSLAAQVPSAKKEPLRKQPDKKQPDKKQPVKKAKPKQGKRETEQPQGWHYERLKMFIGFGLIIGVLCCYYEAKLQQAVGEISKKHSNASLPIPSNASLPIHMPVVEKTEPKPSNTSLPTHMPVKRTETQLAWKLILFEVCLICIACVCCCCCCCKLSYWIARRSFNAVLRSVTKRARPPCQAGTKCTITDEKHLAEESHPDDDDYGFAIRVHGGKASEFWTLRQCFNFMDPHVSGYVCERAAFRVLLEYLGVHVSSAQLLSYWREMDTDGNGYISFIEFVEWALYGPGRRLGFPRHIGLFGEIGMSGAYRSPCTIQGCTCRCFKGKSSIGDRFCSETECGHKRGYHSGQAGDMLKATLPQNWNIQHSSYDNPMDLRDSSHMTDCDADVIAQMQQLMDESVKVAWTRDRGRHATVPTGFEVVRVDRNERVRSWVRYVMKKTLIKSAFVGQPPIPEFEMRTSQLAARLAVNRVSPLDAASNEWFLWHGASSEAARGIAHGEFMQSLAGSSTGTLYGRGTYLSDSCTKADEYAKEIPDGRDQGLFCVLLCRVIGGRVKYVDEVTPNGNKLEKDVLEGDYDCVLGDREASRGTFKEIVIFESAQAYPEYLVYYRRRFP